MRTLTVRHIGRAALIAPLLLGCGASLNAGAEDVEWYTDRPDGELDNRGEVECSRGGNFVSPSANASACRNSIRNQAVARGANIVVVTSEQIGAGQCANCVVFLGTAYFRRPSRAPTADQSTPPTAGGSNPASANAGPPTAAPTPSAASVGQSADTVESEVRAGLDRRRDDILQCTAGEPATIVVAYSATGELSFSLAGTLAGTPAEVCVRSSLGQPTIDTQGRAGAVTHLVEPGGW
jgi:hypothetical protein